MSVIEWLNRVKLDWNDFNETGRITREVVQELAGNRTLLRRLVVETTSNAALRSLAEKHSELNYIVLYDALDRGLRLRLHRFSKGLEDTPHNHRFSFSSAILCGSYVHTLFELDQCSDQTPSQARWELNQPEGTHSGVKVDKVAIAGLTPTLTTTQTAGSAYSLHHQAIHKTAMPLTDAFSLFMRGPAQKACALQLDPDSKTYRWKFGREHESRKVLADRAMMHGEFDSFIKSLEAAQII